MFLVNDQGDNIISQNKEVENQFQSNSEVVVLNLLEETGVVVRNRFIKTAINENDTDINEVHKISMRLQLILSLQAIVV